jgi:hypothetical protein
LPYRGLVTNSRAAAWPRLGSGAPKLLEHKREHFLKFEPFNFDVSFEPLPLR